MLLTDREIKELGNNLITEGYRKECVEAISYRLTVASIIVSKDNGKVEPEYIPQEEYTLHPLDTVYIKTNEKIRLPDYMTARIVERNSMMRKGLFVSGPHYQPGHHTYMFLRVTNLSSKDYKLEKSTDPKSSIAQIEFEKLDGPVENPYDDGRYQNEDSFSGDMHMGITETINRLVEKTEKIQEDTKTAQEDTKKVRENQTKLYSEILTLMSIFVAIFSIIITNIINISKLADINIWNIGIINASLGLMLTAFVGLIMVVLDRIDRKRIIIICVVFFIFLAVLMISTCMAKADVPVSNNFARFWGLQSSF